MRKYIVLGFIFAIALSPVLAVAILNVWIMELARARHYDMFLVGFVSSLSCLLLLAFGSKLIDRILETPMGKAFSDKVEKAIKQAAGK